MYPIPDNSRMFVPCARLAAHKLVSIIQEGLVVRLFVCRQANISNVGSVSLFFGALSFKLLRLWSIRGQEQCTHDE